MGAVTAAIAVRRGFGHKRFPVGMYGINQPASDPEFLPETLRKAA